VTPASLSERHGVARQVASLVGQVLSTECGVDENFLEMGGDSLTALELATALEEAFSIPVSERVIFDHLTPTELADYIIRIGAQARADEPTRIEEPVRPGGQA